MRYDILLLFMDMGIIGSITALIVVLAVVLGRKEDRQHNEAAAAAPVPEGLRQAG